MNKSVKQKSVRIDKWLWAARFFKTRSIAKQAIEGGKIHINGQRTKASREVQLNERVTIRQGWDIKEVVVKEISEQRRGASEAVKLYEETPESISKRLTHAEQRKSMGATQMNTDGKPTSKQRRKIHELKRHLLDDY